MATFNIDVEDGKPPIDFTMKTADAARFDHFLEVCNQAIKERDRLKAIVNTPELVDFPKAVHMEAAHQELRWGTADREGKAPADWFWLVGHLASRALEHHKEAERLERVIGMAHDRHMQTQIEHHREKAVHHCITAAAALSHWHACVLGKHTAMRPSSADAAAAMNGADA